MQAPLKCDWVPIPPGMSGLLDRCAELRGETNILPPESHQWTPFIFRQTLYAIRDHHLYPEKIYKRVGRGKCPLTYEKCPSGKVAQWIFIADFLECFEWARLIASFYGNTRSIKFRINLKKKLPDMYKNLVFTK